jgi:hypothetical protein
MSHLDPALQWWKTGVLWRWWGSSKQRTAWRSAWRIRRNDSRRKYTYINSGMYEAVFNVSDSVGLTDYVRTEINRLWNIRATLSRICSMIYLILPLIEVKIINVFRPVKILRLIIYSVLSHYSLATLLKQAVLSTSFFSSRWKFLHSKIIWCCSLLSNFRHPLSRRGLHVSCTDMNC